jgi:hypothetical protein
MEQQDPGSHNYKLEGEKLLAFLQPSVNKNIVSGLIMMNSTLPSPPLYPIPIYT